MYKVLIAPFSKPLPADGGGMRPSPKDYPWWNELLAELNQKGEYRFEQISTKDQPRLTGVHKYHDNIPYSEMYKLVNDCDFFISVDTLIPHIANLARKRGVVIWGMGHPRFFGYSMNLNILKDEKFVRPIEHTWLVWHGVPTTTECWELPGVVAKLINDNRNKLRG